MYSKTSIIIANWKMKLNLEESLDLTREIVDGFTKSKSDVVLCPSFTSMTKVSELIDSSEIILGAQDVFWEENGAYTGEISVEMLKDLGCEYFIVGHSERREYLGETDGMVNKKVRAVLAQGGSPILCVGETLEERRQGKKDYVITHQVERALEGVKVLGEGELIIAYEPVWVIGTGGAVEPEEASYMAKLIRHIGRDFCQNKGCLRVIYGGSVDSGNIEDFIKQGGIEGFLVGTAALDAGEFLRMVRLVS